MSNSVKVKICGLKRECDIDFVNKSMPDFAGFVFSKSKRQISYSEAEILKKKLSSDIKSVGIFVNEKAEDIVQLCEKKIIDLIQLHGDEDNNFIKYLKLKTEVPIIKAVKALSEDYIKEHSKNDADFILLDSSSKNIFGGTGKVFDWSIIPQMEKPVFLAGGLNIKNVQQAVSMVHPFCVDISSGVETDGVKDEKKISEIITLIRGLRYECN